MTEANNKKILLLKMWEMLSQDSDETHPITTAELLEKLQVQGIKCDRRTIYSNIDTLNQYGYEVQTVKGQHSNSYCVLNRSFDVPELKVLMDAVQAAGFITEKKTKYLVDKIASLGGSHRAKLLKQNIVEFNTIKHSNENIMYNISEIEEGILSGKKISFLYFDYAANGKRVMRKEGQSYIFNPIATVLSNDNYYLAGYHDHHDGLTIYRVDRMIEVKVSDNPINIEKKPKKVDLAVSRKQAFSMYLGDTHTIRFRIHNSLIDVIMDKFGEKTQFVVCGMDYIEFSAEVQLSPVFYGWCCSFDDRLKVVAPEHIVEKIQCYIANLTKLYK